MDRCIRHDVMYRWPGGGDVLRDDVGDMLSLELLLELSQLEEVDCGCRDFFVNEKFSNILSTFTKYPRIMRTRRNIA
jgi:hypothetical protein